MLLACCALLPANATAASTPCALSQTDQAWLDRAMEAWNYTSREITGIGQVKRIEAVIFDAPASSGAHRDERRPAGVAVRSSIPAKSSFPTGTEIPAGVISFARADDKVAFFTMSTPSVWRAAVKSDAGLGSLDLLMIAVLLHEGTHVAQMPTYGERMGRLRAANSCPEDFNDDSIQERFEGDAEFKESIGREVDLSARRGDRPRSRNRSPDGRRGAEP